MKVWEGIYLILYCILASAVIQLKSKVFTLHRPVAGHMTSYAGLCAIFIVSSIATVFIIIQICIRLYDKKKRFYNVCENLKGFLQGEL